MHLLNGKLRNIRFRNRYFLISDTILLTCAAYFSFVLRLEHWNLGTHWPGFALFTGIGLLIMPLTFYGFGIYGRYWRYASIEELLLLSVSAATATILLNGLIIVSLWIIADMIVIPRSVPFIFFLLALVAIALPRLVLRLNANYRPRQHPFHVDASLRILIMGAGNAGEMIVRDLRQNNRVHVTVVGFIDDDFFKHGQRIHGVPVLGHRYDIPRLVQQHAVQQIIIAIASASGKTIRAITAICEQAGVQVRIIPGLHELLDGKLSLNQVRDIQIEDLLRRKPIQTDISAVRALIRGKRVLITGGGGSIGSELCRQAIQCEPAELVILGHGENSIFEIYNELCKLLPQPVNNGTVIPRLYPVIADIRFADRINTVFAHYRPEIVFHAAAHKHVPLMEENVIEAITNNVLGTRHLLQAAQAVHVAHFVMISTDKAVNPTSIMGTSKRIAELLVHHAAVQSGQSYVAVRFGNVLGSRGSVVLTFKKQIAAGGPITVTHPDMCRYFMTIPEAVQLVLQAATLGKGGEVFTLDMGNPIKIADLARDMIELSGLEVDHDIDIVFSGLRPGEKLFEELFIPGEQYRRTRHEKIFIARNASSFVPAQLHEQIDMLEHAAQCNDTDAIMVLLQTLVPQLQRSVADPDQDTRHPLNHLQARAVGY